jgi:uncharacterized membrane protein
MKKKKKELMTSGSYFPGSTVTSKEDVGRHYTPREFHQHMSYLAILQA